jgi:hypothetical protein
MLHNLNRFSTCHTSKVVIIGTVFFMFQLPGKAQLDLTDATLFLSCTNKGGADAFYQLTLKPSFKGGITNRTIVQEFFPGVGKPQVDSGSKLFLRSLVGKHSQAVPATSYKVRGAFTAIRTSPRISIGVFPVPQVEYPCTPKPTPVDDGNGSTARDPNVIICRDGRQISTNGIPCVYSGASLPYSPNKLIASSSHRQFNVQPQTLTDRTLDVIEWKGVRWQVDYTNS